MEGQAIGQWIVLGAVITLIIFDKVKAWQFKNGKKGNPGNLDSPSNPGNPSDRERLATLEEKTDNIEKDIKRIWKKLNKE